MAAAPRRTGTAERIFAQKVALVTGGASGIGAACAMTLAERGALVVVADIDLQGARHVADLIVERGGTAEAEGVDVAVPQALDEAVGSITAKHGGLNVAVNCAGVLGRFAPLADISYAEYQRIIDINLGGVFAAMHAEIPAMLAAGGGVILNISSTAGLVGLPNLSAYTAAKHGIIGLTKAAALEYGSAGIRILAIAPSAVDTPMLRNPATDARPGSFSGHAIKRMGTPQEVADFVCFLASDAAGFLTGSVHALDGGYLAG